MPITLGIQRQRASGGNGERRRFDPAFAQIFRMLERLGRWAPPRADRSTDIYLVRVGDAVALYLVTKSDHYDFQLSRELAEFAAPYVARGVINAATLVPASSPEELAAFFNPDHAFRISFE